MDSGLVRRLRAFRLAQTRPNPVWPQAVAGDAIGQLWAGRHFPALESLALENTPLTPKQLDLLLAGKFNRLTELSLVHCALRDGGAEVLARAATSLTPRELDLRQNLLGEPAVRALARSELPEHLRALNLSSNRLGNAGVAALVSGRTFFALRQLVLRRNRLGDSAARILGAYPVFPRLRKLDLAYNELSLAGVRRLMKCKSLSFLQFLDVRGNTFHRHEKALLRKKWQATC